MFIDMRCPQCGEIIQFDDTQTAMFCPYCGCKVARTAQPGYQPAQAANYQAPQAQANVTPVGTSLPAKKRISSLSVVALVLSLLILLSWLGFILAVIDAFVTDKQKTKNHVLSYWAIGISALILMIPVLSIAGNGSLSRNNSTRDTTTTISTDTTFDDGTVNLYGIEEMDVVAKGKKYTIYDEDFNDYIIEARWWDYDDTMGREGVYNTDTDTLAFSIEVNKDAEDKIYYAYYYSKDKEFDQDDLSEPIYSTTASPEKYNDGTAYYNVDCSKKIIEGYYVVIVASDKSFETPYIVAYAEVK